MNRTTPAPSPGLSWLFRNPLTLVGAALALLGFASFLFLFLTDLFTAAPNPYLGIFAYLISPAVLVLGLILIPVGLLLERRRRRRLGLEEIPAFPRLDLNLPGHRRAVTLVVGATVLFLVFSSAASYQAVRFAESVTFCGQACHSVMGPQFSAYRVTPHARVPCTECHIGPGAAWFVRSKIRGIAQLYAVTFDTYELPIQSRPGGLRPAQDTCEHCHWPDKFWGNQLRTFVHFAASDEKNTRREIQMLVKVGGGSPRAGLPGGIHWHMNLVHEVWYIARDRDRQEIPWVMVRDPSGKTTEYVARGATLTPEEIARADKRRMDCMDCHNRPSHIFLPPTDAVDEALRAGRIDPSLPYIKRQAVEVMTREYPTTAAAQAGIATDLDAFYARNYPALYPQKREAIAAAIAEVQRLYETNIFPEMKTDWRSHPNNIGHLYFPGCMRCHDGQHVSAEGKPIRNECGICHTVLEQTEGGERVAEAAGGAFHHPVDIGDLAEATCSACHTGGVGP